MTQDNNPIQVESFKVSFRDLFQSQHPEIKVEYVRIPMIQRDYAQGRTNKTLVRKRFLEALYGAIDRDDSTPIMLDFVYGQRLPERDRFNDNKYTGKNIFEPIDGQQRLTTLFLLNLYIGKQVNDNLEWLKGFSYETRQSSLRFCEELMKMPPEAFFDLRTYMRSQSWYSRRYKADPTIAGMIQTLTDIAKHYEECQKPQFESIWSRLNVNITFMLLYLKKLNTTDDLYIKMNSRGLHLTEFEQFKAELEGYFKDTEKVQTLDFGTKIDTTWTNLLWEYRSRVNDGVEEDFSSYDPDNTSPYTMNNLDNMFHHIFRRYMLIEGFKNNLFFKKQKDTDKRDILNYSDKATADLLTLAETVFKNVPISERQKRMLRFCVFIDKIYQESQNDGVCDKENVAKYFGRFIYTSSTEKDTATKIRLFGESANFGTDLLSAFAYEGSLNLTLTLILEAFIEQSSSQIPISDFFKRLRIVRNLAAATWVRNENMATLLNRVDSIIKTGDIALEIADFPIVQKKQEIFKILWCEKFPHLVDILHKIENHDIVQGDISAFINGAIEEYLKEGRNYDEAIKYEYFDKFLKLFPENENIDWMLRHQSMMTIADYAQMEGKLALYAGSKKEFWRTRVIQRNNESVYPHVFAMMDKIPDSCDVEKALEEMRSEYLEFCEKKGFYPWPYYVVKYKGIQHGEDCKVYKYDNHEYMVVAYNKTSGNSKRWNPFLCRINKEKTLNGEFNLDNFENRLELTHLQLSVWSDENQYLIRPITADKPEFSLPIPSKDNFDATDRIQLFLNFYGEFKEPFINQDSVTLQRIAEKYDITPIEGDFKFEVDLFEKRSPESNKN